MRSWKCLLPLTDHPRSRGVYWWDPQASSEVGGSSPLARGLPLRQERMSPQLRIIPARAGFTLQRGGVPVGFGDHPRSRGVYSTRELKVLFASGSSPLARGLRNFRGGKDMLPGIIPARAGFTPRRCHRSPASRDHPRSRGVYMLFSPKNIVAQGSSPLARGLPQLALDRHVHGRIIPARAGFTS